MPMHGSLSGAITSAWAQAEAQAPGRRRAQSRIIAGGQEFKVIVNLDAPHGDPIVTVRLRREVV
jgi:hypothetical protein